MRIWTLIIGTLTAITFAGFSGCSCDGSPTPVIVDPLNVSIVINDSLETTRDTVLYITIYGENLHLMQLSLDSTMADVEWIPFIGVQTVHAPRIEGVVTVYARFSSSAGGFTSVLSDDIELDFTAIIHSIEVTANSNILVPGDLPEFTLQSGEEGIATVTFAETILNYPLEKVSNGIFSRSITVPHGIITDSAFTIANFTDVAGNIAEPVIADRTFIIMGTTLTPHIIGSTNTDWNVGYEMWYSGGHCFVGNLNFLDVINVEDLSMPTKSRQFEFTSDVFGMNGNGPYLFVTAESQLKILDINPPDQSRVVKSYLFSGNIRDIEVDHNWAYVASMFEGLRIMNIEHIDGIREISQLDLNITGEHIWQRDDLLYIAGAAGVSTVDITDRENPILLSNLYVYGEDIEDLAYFNNKLYLATQTGGIVTVDVSDPTQPVLGQVYESFGIVNDLILATPYLYISGGDNIRIVNITDEELPVVAVIGEIEGTHGMFLSDRHLFVAGREKFVVVELFEEQ